MILRGVALGMSLKDIIHHRQTQTAYQFAVEHQVAFLHAVAQTVKIGEDMLGLVVGERDDRILVQ